MVNIISACGDYVPLKTVGRRALIERVAVQLGSKGYSCVMT